MSGRVVDDEAGQAGAGLVGREAELRTLVAGFEESARGSARAILLRGPAGSGKTALLDALARHARCSGATILRGSCSSTGPRRPWQAAESLFGEGPPPGRDAVPPPHRLLRRVTEAASSGPVAIMLDDTQWCDEESLAWLDSLTSRGHRLPLLVLLARLRSGANPSGTFAGCAAREHRTLDLGPLPEDSAGELARRCWDVEPEKPFLRACHGVCRGNPALLVRLFERLSRQDVPPDARGALRARELGADLFAGHLLTTIARQPEYVRQVVEALAVLGQADQELVGMLGGVPEPLVAAAVGILRDEEIVKTGLDELNDEDVRVRVLSAMPPGALDRRRSRAARLLNDAGRPVEEISAQLMLLPRLPEPWMRGVLRSAASTAERDGEVGLAARYLGKLVMTDPTDAESQADLARLIGRDDPVGAYAMLYDDVEDAAGHRAKVRLKVQAARVGPGDGETPDPASAGGPPRLGAGGDDRAGHHAGDRAGEDELETVLQSLLLMGARRRSTKRIFEHVLGMRMPEVHATGEQGLAVRSMLSAMSGSSSDACVAPARQALDAPWDDWALAPAAYVLSLADETAEAVQAMDRTVAQATENGDDWARVTALSTRSLIRGEAGDIAGALADAAHALRLADRRAWSDGVAAPRTALAAALVQRGDLKRAAAVLDRIAAPDTADPHGGGPRVLMARAYLAESRGDLEGALSALTACGDALAAAGIRHPRFAPWWVDAACVLGMLDRRNEAQEIVEHGERLAAAWGGASARGLALLARGAITEGGDGVEILAEAVETLAGAPARWYHAAAKILLGEALLRMDDREGARTWFRQAVYVSVRHGFRMPAAKARARLVAAGGWMPQRIGGVKDVLTMAERRVAELAAAGATNREIAGTLRIAVRTVEMHLTSVFRKLEVSGRAELGEALGRTRVFATPLLVHSRSTTGDPQR